MKIFVIYIILILCNILLGCSSNSSSPFLSADTDQDSTPTPSNNPYKIDFSNAELLPIISSLEFYNPFITPQTNNFLLHINAQYAYANGITGANQIISVLDSGVNPNHRDLKNQLLASYNCTNATTCVLSSSSYSSSSSHGTAMASIIVAPKDNESGINMHGVAYNAKILSFNFSGSSGTSLQISPSGFINAYQTALSHGAKIFNMSFGTSSVSNFLSNEISTLTANNDVSLVVATGNDGASKPLSPADLAANTNITNGKLIAVTAVDANSNKASFANECGATKNFCISAPGVSILSAGTGDEGYIIGNGTSQATAIVSGGIALISEAFPALSQADVINIILNTATDLGSAGTDTTYGRGLLNIKNAIGFSSQTSFIPSKNINLTNASSKNIDSIKTLSFSDITKSVSQNRLTDNIYIPSIYFGDSINRSLKPILNKIIAIDHLKRYKTVTLNDAIVNNYQYHNYELYDRLSPFNNKSYSPVDLTFNSFKVNLNLQNNINNNKHLTVRGQKIRTNYEKHLIVDSNQSDDESIDDIAMHYDLNTKSALQFYYKKNLNNIQNNIQNNQQANIRNNVINSFIANPYYNIFGENNKVIGFTHKFSASEAIKFLFGSNQKNQKINNVLNVKKQNYIYTSQLSINKPNYNMLIDLGSLIEQEGMLGSIGKSNLQLSESSQTFFTNFLFKKDLFAKNYFLFRANYAFSKGKNVHNSIFHNLSNLYSSSYTAGIINENFANQKLGFFYHSPLKIIKGNANVTIPTHINLNGEILYNNYNISLNPSSREQNYILFYELSNLFNKNAILNSYIQLKMNPNHSLENNNEWLFFLSLKMNL